MDFALTTLARSGKQSARAALVVALLLAGGAWWWLGRHESAVERAVKDHLNSAQHAQADSVSCGEDHELQSGGRTFAVYRCFPREGTFDGIETCVIWNGKRLIREPEWQMFRFEDTFCEGQG